MYLPSDTNLSAPYRLTFPDYHVWARAEKWGL